MKNWFKKLKIPSGEKTEVVAYKSWTVRWYSWHGSNTNYPHQYTQCEIFPSEIDANNFAAALKEAYKLVRCSGDCFDVWVQENQNKLANLTQ